MQDAESLVQRIPSDELASFKTGTGTDLGEILTRANEEEARVRLIKNVMLRKAAGLGLTNIVGMLLKYGCDPNNDVDWAERQMNKYFLVESDDWTAATHMRCDIREANISLTVLSRI